MGPIIKCLAATAGPDACPKQFQEAVAKAKAQGVSVPPKIDGIVVLRRFKAATDAQGWPQCLELLSTKEADGGGLAGFASDDASALQISRS